MSYMQNPTETLVEYLTRMGWLQVRDRQFRLGRLSLALEVITVIKTLEDERVPTMALSKEETISVLQTLLQDCGLAEEAMEWYDRLSEWRRPKFVAENGPSPSRTSDALPPPSDAHASLGESPRRAPSLDEHTRALEHLRRSPAPPLDESGELPDEGAQPKLIS